VAFDPASRDARDSLRLRLDVAARDIAEHRKLGDSLGTADLSLAVRIQRLGFDEHTAIVFDLLPLIHVAWADGIIQAEERKLISEVLRVRGISAGTPAYVLMGALLEARPSETYMRESLDVLRELLSRRAATAETIANLCVDVAAASRGLFGLGRAIDRSERELLVQIGESLGARALARVDERLRGG
jgi:tellurite resistance protein